LLLRAALPLAQNVTSLLICSIDTATPAPPVLVSRLVRLFLKTPIRHPPSLALPRNLVPTLSSSRVIGAFRPIGIYCQPFPSLPPHRFNTEPISLVFRKHHFSAKQSIFLIYRTPYYSLYLPDSNLLGSYSVSSVPSPLDSASLSCAGL